MKIKKQINENVFDAVKRFTDAFFDGLKKNTVNKALKAAEKNPKVPPPVIQKMKEINKLAKELEKDLEYYL
jgi:hypothetical protein